jgi:glycosyltransferase involved in cell wall biosynthesis
MTLRVLHAPFDVAGNASTLAQAERELGLDSACVVLAGRGPWRELERWRLLVRALRHFDVVHFNFGSTFLPRWWPSVHRGRRAAYGRYARALELRDLGWLRSAGKAIFVTYQGDDVRTADALRARLGAAPWLDEYYDARDDERKRLAANRVAPKADGVFVLNPDLVELVPQSQFLPYANVDLRVYKVAPAPSNAKPVVVHAPTERRTKGTEHVLAAATALGDVELRLVERVTRAEVRTALEQADVYVDQLLVGWYGGTAVEAMALGRPVVAYVREDDLRHVPAEMRDDVPVVRATPETLPDAIRDALRRRDELADRGRAYVERWHDPLRVAERTKAAYEDAVARITRR